MSKSPQQKLCKHQEDVWCFYEVSGWTVEKIPGLSWEQSRTCSSNNLCIFYTQQHKKDGRSKMCETAEPKWTVSDTLFKLSSLRWTISSSCFFSFPASWFTASLSSSIFESVCLHHQIELVVTDASCICSFSKNPNKMMKFSSVFFNNKLVTCHVHTSHVWSLLKMMTSSMKYLKSFLRRTHHKCYYVSQLAQW